LGGSFYLFSLGGIPVHAQSWYLLAALYMIRSGSTVQEGVVWAVCVTFSILVHELGHALVAARFKLQPSIVLHGWGGMTPHAPARRDRDDALVVAAGPAAGLLLGAIVFAANAGLEVIRPGLVDTYPLVSTAIGDLLFINLFWSLVNLLPMFPLDGGLLFRLGAYRLLGPRTARRVVHGLGLGLALGWVAVGWGLSRSAFLVIMGLMFAWQNFRVLSGRVAAPRSRGLSEQATTIRDDARAAFAAHDYREAARLCHFLRNGHRLPPQDLAETLALLVRSLGALGAHEEALSWARHAPATGPVIETRLDALLALGRVDDARTLLAEHGQRLGAAARAAFTQKLAG
jgi:Zn-dependent protease